MNRVKRIIGLLAISASLLSLNACQDVLKDEFYNPEQQTKPSFDMLFTSVLQTPDLFRQDYGSNYHLIRFSGRVLGLTSYPSAAWNARATDAYMHWTDWSGATLRDNLWNFVYVNSYKNIPIMNMMINNLPENERKDYDIYVKCVNVCRAYMFQRLTDAYDDIPFTEAGGAWEMKFVAKYDTQKDIYYTLLDDLKKLSDELSQYQLSNSMVHQKFRVADILNNGDVKKWAKFANSLRLRMAMRISVVEPAKSKQIIQEILSSPAGLITENSQEVGMAEKDVSRVWEVYWPRALYDMYYQAHAPRSILTGIFGYTPTAPANQVDPRTFVVFQPSVQGRYVGVEKWGAQQDPQIDIDFPNPDDNKKVKAWDYDDNLDPMFSMYNKMTYYNFDMKFPTISPSEVHLLLAEAAVRFPDLGLNSSDEYKKAIQTSIDWYYTINNGNKYSETSTPNIIKNIMPGSKYPKPDQAVIDGFLTFKTDSYNAKSNDDKIKEIFNQKLAHLNYLNPMEVWSEARRLQKEYGLLAPKANCVKWMERFYYPVSEAQTNPTNFQKVTSQNDAVSPVWWTGRKK